MMPPKPTLSQRLDAGGKNFVEQNCLPLQEAGISAFFPPTLSLSLKKMEFALAQAKKSCPFLHITPTSSLRRLSTLPAGANSTNGLLTKAQQCPVMGKAIAVRTRGISTTAAAAQKPTPSAKAVAVESAENGM